MGVEGFLRQVKDALEEAHLRKFSGQTIVVDAFSWLHKACYGCAFELATGKETDSYVRYMLRKVDLMRSCGVKEVILVFDGQRLPLKVGDRATSYLRGSNPFMKKLFNLTTGEKDATRMFVQFCVLSGCDFLDSLPNMGIVTALKQIFNFRGAPGHLRVQRILSKLSSSGVKIPPDFIERFVQAESIFFHHVVFNPSKQVCEFLIDDSHQNCHADIFKRVLDSLGIAKGSEIDVDGEAANLHAGAVLKSSFLGVVLAPEVVNGIYNGSTCPRTLRSLTEPHNDADELRPYSPQPTTPQANNKHEYGSAAFEVEPLGDSNTNGEEEINSILRASPAPTIRSQRARQEEKTPPSPETLERKRNVQAKQRSSTFKSLLSVYAKADSEQELGTLAKSADQQQESDNNLIPRPRGQESLDFRPCDFFLCFNGFDATESHATEVISEVLSQHVRPASQEAAAAAGFYSSVEETKQQEHVCK